MKTLRKKLVYEILDYIKTLSDDVEKLPTERELAQKFKVSRSLLREALVALETLGLLEIRERQGVYIIRHDFAEFTVALSMLSDFPQDILRQTAEARIAVETQAAMLACLRRTETDLESLKESFDHLEQLHANYSDDKAPMQAYWNKIFHLSIVKASHNIVLQRMFEGMIHLIEKTIELIRNDIVMERDLAYADLIAQQHREIFEAIASRNSEVCERVMRKHIELGLDKQMKYVAHYFEGASFNDSLTSW